VPANILKVLYSSAVHTLPQPALLVVRSVSAALLLLWGGATNYTVTGGKGKLTGASGSFTVTYRGNTLAAPGTPPGKNGLFGAITRTATGSITK
jgi:hypothetical protein